MSVWTWLAAREAAREPAVLCVVTEVGGSTPRLAGATMAVSATDQIGTVGGGALELRVIASARALLAAPGERTAAVDVHLVHDLGMCCGGRMAVFLTKLDHAPRLWIYGAGHVGTALAPAARAAGFAVTVIDGRAEWADASRFAPDVEVIDADPEDHVRSTPPPPEDYVVVMTHSHPLDEALIGRLAPRRGRYLGLIGSRRKRALFERRLQDRGVALDDLARVRCPVGLPIEAETPAEIAVSIVAELIAVRRGQP
ncbi:MAG: xanthine dehydrogenase accessory protein XdhC [bacterium]